MAQPGAADPGGVDEAVISDIPRARVIQDPALEEALDGLDPQGAYADAIGRGRVFHNPDGSITLLRMSDILQINRDRSVRGIGGLGTIGGADRTRPLVPLEIDGPEHTRWRKVLDPVFAPKRMAQLEPDVRALARDLLDTFASDGEADVYERFCKPLPQTIFLRLLGLPVSDVDVLDVLHGDEVATKRRNDYLRAAIAERMDAGEHRDDLLGWLLDVELDGERLSLEECLDVAILFTIAGLDTVSSSLACTIGRLARHPDERAVLVADPARWHHAVEEYLRFESPVTEGFRVPTTDIVLSGETIAAGTVVRLSWSAANLDPDAFVDPMRVDLDRAAIPHVAFASGFHRCLGSHLARMELRVALEEFHRRIPAYRLADPAAVRFVAANPRHPNALRLVWDVPA